MEERMMPLDFEKKFDGIAIRVPVVAGLLGEVEDTAT